MNLPVQVLESVENRRCVLFSGRRASTELLGPDSPSERDLALKLTGQRVGLPEAFAMVDAQEGREQLVIRLQEDLLQGEILPGSFHVRAVQRFPVIFTTSWDDLFEQAALQEGVPCRVSWRGEPFPEPEDGAVCIHHLWGGFHGPDGPCLTAQDRRDVTPVLDEQRYWRSLLRGHVALFVGYRPDEGEMDLLFDELVAGYGGTLPRTHWAVAQGRISDVLWQKWVWRGMLLFTADPSEVTTALEAFLNA